MARQLHEYLLREASVPYLRMLHQWITKGIIRDPYQEFMVVFNPKVPYSAAKLARFCVVCSASAHAPG